MKSKSGFLSTILVILLPLVHTHADTIPFQHWEHQFSLTVPSEFSVEKDPTSNVGVLLRHAAGGYPTFNVLALPGPYKALAQSEAQQQRELIDEYAQVGLRQVELSNAGKLEIGGRNAFRADLRYQIGSERLRSTVIKLSGISRHYVLTYIDQDADYDSRSQYLQQLLASFTSWGDSQVELAKELQFDRNMQRGWLVAILCAVLALIVAPLLIHRHHVRIRAAALTARQ